MTQGEMMVWAAAFAVFYQEDREARPLEPADLRAMSAAGSASTVVDAMRHAAEADDRGGQLKVRLTEESRAMLDHMLGVGSE